MEQPDKVAYARCSCSNEVLLVEYNEEWKEFNISIYELSHETTWKQKFRYIWRIIKTGAPYGDQVVPDKEEMRDIQQLLNEVLEES